jgi:hypothetical protein
VWEAISVEQTNQYAHTGTYSVRINANGDILGHPDV